MPPPVIEVIDLSSDSEDEPVEPAPVRPSNECADPRLSHLKCVICLDSPTDLTATNCGHLFCHECITAALKVSGGQSGNCPVCRRKTTLKSLIPLNILKQSLLGADAILPERPVVPAPVDKPTPRRTTRKRPAP